MLVCDISVCFQLKFIYSTTVKYSYHSNIPGVLRVTVFEPGIWFLIYVHDRFSYNTHSRMLGFNLDLISVWRYANNYILSFFFPFRVTYSKTSYTPHYFFKCFTSMYPSVILLRMTYFISTCHCVCHTKKF